MNYAKETLSELAAKAASASSKHAIIGMDGFVDKIIRPVDTRFGQGSNFQAIPTIDAFGKRILAAAGKSANIELYQDFEKLGGNGPIMANALLANGLNIHYIGALGHPSVHPVFEEFASKVQVSAITDPGVTNALEFEDGKIMLGSMSSLDDITYERMLNEMGEGALLDTINRADLIGMVNWTMIPNMTSLLESILTKVLPNLGPKESGRTFFFDLTDPAKRSKAELRAVLEVISRYRSHGAVTLGLNFSEALQVAEVLELGSSEDNPEDLKAISTRIRNAMSIACVVVHPRAGAACATKDGSWYVEGPFCKSPKISTGAGDHFNAGFATAQTIGLSPESALMVAVATSGQYVRSAQSPSLQDTARFIESWTSGSLSD